MENIVNRMISVLSSNTDVADIPRIGDPVWTDPKIWIISSIFLVVLIAILIYCKVLTGTRKI